MNLKEYAIALIIRTRLAEDKRTSGQTIDVYVADDEIILVGTVDSEMQRITAEEIIRGLPGVRHIIDNIRIRHVRAVPA